MRKAEVKQLNTSVMCGMVGSSVFLVMCNFPDFVKTTRSSSVAIAANTFKQEWKQFAKFIFQTQFSRFRPEIVFFHLAIQAWLAASCRITFSIVNRLPKWNPIGLFPV